MRRIIVFFFFLIIAGLMLAMRKTNQNPFVLQMRNLLHQRWLSLRSQQLQLIPPPQSRLLPLSQSQATSLTWTFLRQWQLLRRLHLQTTLRRSSQLNSKQWRQHSSRSSLLHNRKTFSILAEEHQQLLLENLLLRQTLEILSPLQPQLQRYGIWWFFFFSISFFFFFSHRLLKTTIHGHMQPYLRV